MLAAASPSRLTQSGIAAPPLPRNDSLECQLLSRVLATLLRSRPGARFVPQFHFHVLDGSAVTDIEGLELPNIAAAKSEAIRLAGAVLRDYRGDDLWRGEPWQIIVND